jgi:hypothetical protein
VKVEKKSYASGLTTLFKITIFWFMIPCSLTDGQCLGETCCLHFQNRTVSHWYREEGTNGSSLPFSTSLIIFPYTSYFPAFKMVAADFSKMLTLIYQSSNFIFIYQIYETVPEFAPLNMAHLLIQHKLKTWNTLKHEVSMYVQFSIRICDKSFETKAKTVHNIKLPPLIMWQ